MKKRPLVPAWAETVVPVLPLLGTLVSWKAGFEAALSGAAIFFVLAIFFKLFSVILGRKQIWVLFVFAASAGVYVLGIFWDLPAELVLSLCLLGPAAGDKKKYNPKMGAAFLKGFIFFALVLYLAAAQEFLGGTLHLSFFQRVSGTFLLLLLPALLWPASRKIKGKLPRRALLVRESTAV